MKLLKTQVFYTFLGRLTKREKTIFYVAISFIALTLLDRSILNPIMSKMEFLDRQIQEKESGINRNLRILAQKDRILSESAKFNSLLSSFRFEEEEATSLLKEIEALANKSSVYIIDMKPMGFKEVGSSKRYFINLNCEAQMGQIIDFMYNIENSNRLLSVDRYQINPKSKESSIAVCSMSISKMVMP